MRRAEVQEATSSITSTNAAVSHHDPTTATMIVCDHGELEHRAQRGHQQGLGESEVARQRLGATRERPMSNFRSMSSETTLGL